MIERLSNQAWRRLLKAAFFTFVVIWPAASDAAPAVSPDVLMLSEAAELLRIDATELEQIALRNEVPARRIGSDWRFNREALLAWVNGDWGRIATIEPPDAATRRQALARAEAVPAAPTVSLTPQELEQTKGAGMVVAQAPEAPSTSTPSPGSETPIGEAPQEQTAEEVFLRGQRVLLGRGEVAIDVGQFYSRGDTTQLAVVGEGVGLATIRQSTFTTFASARLGVLNETELFLSTIFRNQNSDVFAGAIRVAEDHRTEFGDIRFGVRRTLLTEGPGRPNLIANAFGHFPTGETSYAVGGGLSVVKSFDPVVLFATANYRHTFSRDFADVTRLEPEERFDVTLGYALGLNDTLTISTSVSGLFSGRTTFSNATLLRQDVYSLQLGLTSWLAQGLYIEPTVSFGLSGPGNSFAFGVTLPYTF